MREELDNLLCEKYPKIFKDRNAPMNETAMCWGFSHGDGWYNIIDNLCACIQNHIDWAEASREREINKGKETGEPGHPRTPHVEQVVAIQVKEKFGTLRFYYSGGDDAIDGMVRMAEAMSSVTCEECGNPGKSRSGGWIHTYCTPCEEARDNARSN